MKQRLLNELSFMDFFFFFFPAFSCTWLKFFSFYPFLFNLITGSRYRSSRGCVGPRGSSDGNGLLGLTFFFISQLVCISWFNCLLLTFCFIRCRFAVPLLILSLLVLAWQIFANDMNCGGYVIGELVVLWRTIHIVTQTLGPCDNVPRFL